MEEVDRQLVGQVSGAGVQVPRGGIHIGVQVAGRTSGWGRQVSEGKGRGGGGGDKFKITPQYIRFSTWRIITNV